MRRRHTDRAPAPASKRRASAVAVAGSAAPAFSCCCCCYCTVLRLHATRHSIHCVILLQCLPRDGSRPPSTNSTPLQMITVQYICALVCRRKHLEFVFKNLFIILQRSRVPPTTNFVNYFIIQVFLPKDIMSTLKGTNCTLATDIIYSSYFVDVCAFK